MTSPLTETGKVNGDLGEGETEDVAEGLPIGVSYAPGIGSSPSPEGTLLQPSTRESSPLHPDLT